MNDCLLIGDCNARLSDLQILPDDIKTKNTHAVRESKDKILNREGNKLLGMCEDKDLCVLNGRTADDREGEYTYVSTRGSSLIDYCCVPYPLLNYVNSLIIIIKKNSLKFTQITCLLNCV